MLSTAEGEIAIKAILENNIPFGKLYQYHTSLVTRQSLREQKIPRPEFLDNLDEIPPLDFSLLHNDIYDRTQIIFNTSRGCPFNCIFCAASVLSGKKIRLHSENRIKSDFMHYYELGYREFAIFDENFLFYRERALSILNFMAGYKNCDISVNFPGGVMVSKIDEEVCRVLAKLNIKDIGLALENGSERVLKEIINKPVRLSDFRRAINALEKCGIDKHIFIVSGLPGETDEDRKLTTDLLKEANVTWVSFNLAMPLIGSRLYSICAENGWLVNDRPAKLWGTASIELPEYSASYLKEAVYRMNLDVNFVNNSDVKNGNLEKVIGRFEHIAHVYKDHAFAFYMLARCYYKLNDRQWEDYYARYLNIISNNADWMNRARYFKLQRSERPVF